MNGAFIDRNAREPLGAQQLDELLDGCIAGHGNHFRPRLHGLPNRLTSELDHGLDQIPVSFVQNTLFLPRFDQSIHGFSGCFRLLVGMFLGKGGDGLTETKDQCERQDQVIQKAQQKGPMSQPGSFGTREKNKREKTVKNHYHQD